MVVDWNSSSEIEFLFECLAQDQFDLKDEYNLFFSRLVDFDVASIVDMYILGHNLGFFLGYVGGVAVGLIVSPHK